MHAIADDGCQIHVEVDGPTNGPVVVLANSLAATIDMWVPQTPVLTEAGYRVIRFDARGHGRSDVPDGPYSLDRLGRDALAVLDRCALEKVAWCGLSLGGLVGMWAAIHAPERLSSLCLANTAASFPPASIWHDRSTLARREGMAEIAETTIQRWLTAAFRATNPEVTAHIRGIIATTQPEGYAGCCAVLAATDLTTQLSRIRCATRVIGGHHDPSTTAETVSRLASMIDGARLTLLDAAHLSNVEADTAFNAALLDHLDAQRRTT